MQTDYDLLLVQHIWSAPFITPQTKVTKGYISPFNCPFCGGKNKGYAPAESPKKLFCSRESCIAYKSNKGQSTADYFGVSYDIEKQFPPSKKEKNKPAIMYLKSRGLEPALDGLKVEYWKDVRKSGSGAAMVPLVNSDSDEKQVRYNGRLLKKVEGIGKTHNSGGPMKGCYFMHPAINYDPDKKTYITEGWIDSVSLILLSDSGQSTAVLSSGANPSDFKFPKIGKLVIAFDNDLSGAAGLKKWREEYPDIEAIMPDKGKDWNDLLRNGDIEQVKAEFRNSYPRFEFNAALALAKTPQEKASLFYKFHNRPINIFTHMGSTYFGSLKKSGEESSVIVEKLGSFIVTLESILKITDYTDAEYRYCLKVKKQQTPAITATATGKDLSRHQALTEWFLTKANAAYLGGAQAAKMLVARLLATPAPVTRLLKVAGYDPISKFYFSPGYGFDTSGKLVLPDSRGLFKISSREFTKLDGRQKDEIGLPSTKKISMGKLYSLFSAAYGNPGKLCLFWSLGVFFVNQIKDSADGGFYPFLSIYGEPASSKTSILRLLQQFQGLNTEGIPILQVTKKAGLRKIAAQAGRFSALIEGNERNDNQRNNFDFQVLLPLFNKNDLSSRAAFSNDNAVIDTAFTSALVFAANVENFRGEAEKSRVLSVEFKKDYLTADTRAAFDELQQLSLKQKTCFIYFVLKHRASFENEWTTAFLQAQKDFHEIGHQRVKEIYSMVFAFYRLFLKRFSIKEDESELLEFMKESARQKERSVVERDPDLADHFFETVDLLEEDRIAGCYHIDKKRKLLYLNLPGIEMQIRRLNLPLIVNAALTTALTNHPSFLKRRHNFRFPDDSEMGADLRPKVRRVYLFDATKIN